MLNTISALCFWLTFHFRRRFNS